MHLISPRDNFPPQSNFPQLPHPPPLPLPSLSPFPRRAKLARALLRLESLPRGQKQPVSQAPFKPGPPPAVHPFSRSLLQAAPFLQDLEVYGEEEEPPVSNSAGTGLPLGRRLLPSHRLQSAREGGRASSSSSRGCSAKPNQSDLLKGGRSD